VLDLDGAAAREALLVLPERAGGVDRPGVDADVALDDDLGGGLLAGGHEGDGRGGEEGESELGHFRFVCLRVGAYRLGCRVAAAMAWESGSGRSSARRSPQIYDETFA